jgi:hypothetical protein
MQNLGFSPSAQLGFWEKREVEFKPVPHLSSQTGLQPGRLRVVRGPSPPDTFAVRTSNEDMKSSIEGSVAQASVMWLLHRGLEAVQDRHESLEHQIVRFSSAVFEALVTSYPALRHEGNERLWLIYFKGVLNANTHSREETVLALRNIASGNRFGDFPPTPDGPEEAEKPTLGPDAEALEQIARGLKLDNSSF